jgi:hypothetical protein
MISWATRRRLIYSGIVIVILAVIAALVFFMVFHKTPSCSDKIMNGDETGIDCGGSCRYLCTTDTLTPVVLWSKVFNISGDVYSLVAFIENPNINSENQSAAYQFKVYDTDNKLITIKKGVTSIPKNKKFTVFDTGILLKNNKPKSADFQFVSFGPWTKNTVKEPEISLRYGIMSSTSTIPSLAGVITNESLKNIPKIELVVVALDNKENAIAASRTYIDNLSRGSSQDFIFTWQKPFSENVGVINLVYRFVNP